MADPKTIGLPDFLTFREVADLLRVSERTLRRITNARQLPFYKIGGRLRFAPEDVKAFAHQCRTGLAAEW